MLYAGDTSAAGGGSVGGDVGGWEGGLHGYHLMCTVALVCALLPA